MPHASGLTAILGQGARRSLLCNGAEALAGDGGQRRTATGRRQGMGRGDYCEVLRKTLTVLLPELLTTRSGRGSALNRPTATPLGRAPVT